MNGKIEGKCIAFTSLLSYNYHDHIFAKGKEGGHNDAFAWKVAAKPKDEAAKAVRQAEYLQGYQLCGYLQHAQAAP